MILKALIITTILTRCIFLTIGCFTHSGLKTTGPDKRIVNHFFIINRRTFYTIKSNQRAIADTSGTGWVFNQQPLRLEYKLRFSSKYNLQEQYSSLWVYSHVIIHYAGYLIQHNDTGPNRIAENASTELPLATWHIKAVKIQSPRLSYLLGPPPANAF